MDENKRKVIDALRKMFTVTVAAFEMKHEISRAFGYLGYKSYIHQLHIIAKNEIYKDKPNMHIIDRLLEMMEAVAESNDNKPKN